MRPIIDRLESAQGKIDSAIIALAGIESDDSAIAMAMLKKAGERLALALADMRAEQARESAEHLREAV